jgi:hypothetical protein
MNNAALASHGQETSVDGVRQWEIYDNTFIYSDSGTGPSGNPYPLSGFNYWFECRGGTGVFCNNTAPAIPWGKAQVQLNVFNIRRLGQTSCQTAYPAARQVGRGWSASSNVPYGNPVVERDGTGDVCEPIYVWGNTGGIENDPAYVALNEYYQDDCGNGQTITDYVHENRDYYKNVARPDYTPYTYPHPLRGGAPIPPPQDTYSISGSITNGAGATVTLSGAANSSTTADGTGNYSFSALGDGAYTVTPTLSGYTFSPTSQAVTVSGANVTGVAFTGTPISGTSTYSISGSITQGAGATVTLSGGANSSTIADGTGNYSFSGLSAGEYTVTPTPPVITFSPTNQPVTVSDSHVTDINFSGGAAGGGGIASVQGNSAFTNASSSTLSCGLTGAQTVGNANMVVICTGSASGAISSLSDTQGNTYTLVGQATGSTGLGQWIYSGVINSGGTGNAVTVTMAGPVNGLGIAVWEYSGLASASAIDGTPQSAANWGTNATTPPLTTTNANDLIFVAATGDSNKQFSAGTGYTLRATFGDWPCTAVEDEVTSAVGEFVGSFTNEAQNWVAQCVALKAAVGLQDAASRDLADTNRATFERKERPEPMRNRRRPATA